MVPAAQTRQSRTMTTTSTTATKATTTPTAALVRPGRPGLRAAVVAAVVGSAYAAVSIAWGLGSTVLLDTVGGDLAAGGRAGAGIIVVVLWAAVMLKVAAVVLPLLVAAHTMRPVYQRVVRVLTWIEAVALTGYGLVLTTVGLLVVADVVHAAPGADNRALAWHAFVWDPWFLVWGVLVLLTLLGSRIPRQSPS